MSNFQLPEKISKTLYVTLGVGRINHGSIDIYDFKVCTESQSEGFEKVVLCTKDIEIDIPQDTDVLGKQIQILEARRMKLHEKFTRDLSEIDRNIAELLALPAPSFDDELPYHPHESTDDGDYTSN